jgi:hypothetical protein
MAQTGDADLELTAAQARTTERLATRARKMYRDRHGGGAVAGVIKQYERRAGELAGEGGPIRFGFGSNDEEVRQLAAALRAELNMERRRHAQDWASMDGNELNAAERAIEKLERAAR